LGEGLVEIFACLGASVYVKVPRLKCAEFKFGWGFSNLDPQLHGQLTALLQIHSISQSINHGFLEWPKYLKHC